MHMEFSVPLDQDLLAEAAAILGTTDPSDTVTRALQQLIELGPLADEPLAASDWSES